MMTSREIVRRCIEFRDPPRIGLHFRVLPIDGRIWDKTDFAMVQPAQHPDFMPSDEGADEWGIATIYAQDGGLVFVDSGAFRADRTGEEIRVWTPEGKIFWDKVFKMYHAFVKGVGEAGAENIFLVAPDKVGDFDTSMSNLGAYIGGLNAFMNRGVNALLPVHKHEHDSLLKTPENDGEGTVDFLLSQFEHPEKVIVSFPSNKKAWSIKEILAWVDQVLIGNLIPRGRA